MLIWTEDIVRDAEEAKLGCHNTCFFGKLARCTLFPALAHLKMSAREAIRAFTVRSFSFAEQKFAFSKYYRCDTDFWAKSFHTMLKEPRGR